VERVISIVIWEKLNLRVGFMNEEKVFSFAFSHANPVTASIEQESYLNSGSYTISGSAGKIFTRIRQLLAFNPSSGNILVKEKTYCNDYNYEKMFVVSRDGKPEKYKGADF
jgi:hypothetical protein